MKSASVLRIKEIQRARQQPQEVGDKEKREQEYPFYCWEKFSWDGKLMAHVDAHHAKKAGEKSACILPSQRAPSFLPSASQTFAAIPSSQTNLTQSSHKVQIQRLGNIEQTLSAAFTFHQLLQRCRHHRSTQGKRFRVLPLLH